MENIVLVGGSRLFRNGLKLTLAEYGAAISDEFSSADEVNVRGKAREEAPLFLLGGDGPRRDGRQAISALRRSYPKGRIAIMVSTLTTHDLVELFTAGADGLLLEEIGGEALYGSLKLITMGEKVFPSQLATLLSNGSASAEPVFHGRHGQLSGREVQILRCLTLGMSNKEIAIELDLAVATVKVHVKSLLKKLGMHNRTQAAIWALDNGLANSATACVRPDRSDSDSRSAANGVLQEEDLSGNVRRLMALPPRGRSDP